MRTYRINVNEINRLKKLYLSTKFAYQMANRFIKDEIKQEFRRQDREEPYDGTAEVVFEGEVLTKNLFEMRNKLKSTFTRMLRESLFVKIMSVFEAFLVDVLKELAQYTIEPFKTQRVYEYHVAQLLSFHDIGELNNQIIEREIRDATSGNLNKIRKYYERQFGVNLSLSGVDLRKLDEMYDRRNLLVHAGGQVDRGYLAKYSMEYPKLRIGKKVNVSEDYFLEAIANVLLIMEYVQIEFDSKWGVSINELKTKKKMDDTNKKKIKEKGEPERKRIFKFRVVFKDNRLLQVFLNDDFQFGFGKEQYCLKDIVTSRHKISDTEAEWFVEGVAHIIGAYRGYMKRQYKKKDIFESFLCETVS